MGDAAPYICVCVCDEFCTYVYKLASGVMSNYHSFLRFTPTATTLPIAQEFGLATGDAKRLLRRVLLAISGGMTKPTTLFVDLGF